MTDLESLNPRRLQLEVARALASLGSDNNSLSKFNKQAAHDSVAWYKIVINWYINEYGGLPSVVGPGKDINLIHEDI